MSGPVLTTIKNLESLAADFAVAVQSAAGLAPLPPEIRARKEALLTISILLTKLNEKLRVFRAACCVPIVPVRLSEGE